MNKEEVIKDLKNIITLLEKEDSDETPFLVLVNFDNKKGRMFNSEPPFAYPFAMATYLFVEKYIGVKRGSEEFEKALDVFTKHICQNYQFVKPFFKNDLKNDF